MKQQWLDLVEYAGVIATVDVTKVIKDAGLHSTLGIGYGEYIDITVQKPVAYRDGDIVHGSMKAQVEQQF